MEDRSALFNQLKEFSQRKLKKVETKVVTGLGENLVEKRGAKGLQVLKDGGGGNNQGLDSGQEPPRKLDLQVGFVLPGLLMGSQDVAHDKSSLESYGIEYILNLDAGVENKFEDEYNYKNVPMKDISEFKLENVLDDCFDFIDDGRHRSNVFVHCSGTVGLSRCTTICVAYLMNKEKLSFNDAFNQVKEARSFVKPNEGFLKQLKDYEVKLRGAQQVKDSGIDDPFALRKKQEIEQEKAMVAGAASVKNRMKMFGATLDSTADSSSRSKSVSPMPMNRQQAESSPPKPQSKWSATSSSRPAPATPTSTKSMTPEPRSWTSKPTTAAAAGPPPPPPPMPAVPLHANNKSFPPPPPPPPPPTGSLLENNNNKSSSSNQSSRLSQSSKANPTTSKPTTTTTTKTSSSDDTKQPLVFGRRPPPPMKLRGGISMERSDSITSNDSKQPATTKTHSTTTQRPQVLERCASPLVLTNNVTPSPTLSYDQAEPRANPFEYWQRTLKERADQQPMTQQQQQQQQLPKRTVSLGPRRQVSAGLQLNPFLRGAGGGNELKSAAPAPRPPLIRRPSNESFDRAAHDLQSSLTELDQLIKSGETQTLRQRSSTFTQQQQQQQPTRRTEPKPLMIPLSAQPGHLSASGFISRTGCEPEDDGPSVPRWQWQDDLTNWKMSSSVNDLRSMFDQPKISSQSSRLPPASRPPVGMSTRMRRLTGGSNDTKGSLQLPLKKQFTSDSDSESGGGGGGSGRAENPRAPSPSAALRAAKQQATSSQNKTGDEHSKLPPTSGGGLNRSSTKKLLNLIKTKTRTDLTLPDGDENDEIEALLGALESESIDNIDWDELGLDEDEVKDIIKRGGELSESGESESSEEEEDDEEDEDEEEEEVETSTMHYVIRTK